MAGPGWLSVPTWASFLTGCKRFIACPEGGGGRRGADGRALAVPCGLLEDKPKWNLSEIGHLFLRTQRCCPPRKCQCLCIRKEASVEPGASLPVLQSCLCPLPRCVTLNEGLCLSVPQLPHLQNGDFFKKVIQTVSTSWKGK